MERWRRLTNDSTAPLTAYGLAVAGARFGEVEPRQAAARRAARLPTWAEGRAEVAWLDGILAHAGGDTAGPPPGRPPGPAGGGGQADPPPRPPAGLAAARGREGPAAPP